MILGTVTQVMLPEHLRALPEEVLPASMQRYIDGPLQVVFGMMLMRSNTSRYSLQPAA